MKIKVKNIIAKALLILSISSFVIMIVALVWFGVEQMILQIAKFGFVTNIVTYIHSDMSVIALIIAGGGLLTSILFYISSLLLFQLNDKKEKKI